MYLRQSFAALGLIALVLFSTRATAAPTVHGTLDNADVAGGTVRNMAPGATVSGTLTGTSSTAGVVGEARTGFSDANFFHYGNNFNVGTGNSHTVSLWFQAPDVTTTQFLVSDGNAISGDDGWSIFMQNGQLAARAAFVGDNGGTDRLGVRTAISTGQWYHVAMVIDQSQGKLIGYLDGLGSGTTTQTTNVPLANGWSNQGGGGQTNTFTPNKNFTAGSNLNFARGPNAGNSFGGMLDDVAIWNEAISPTRVRSLTSIATDSSLKYNAGGAQGLWNVADSGGTVTLGNRTWSRVANGSLAGAPGVATPIAGNPGQYSLALDTSGNGVASATHAYVDSIVANSSVAYFRLGEAAGGFYSATNNSAGNTVGTVTRGIAGPDATSAPNDFPGFETGNRGVSFANTPGPVAATNYIRVPHTTLHNPGTGDFSIEAWVQLDNNQTDTAAVLGKMTGARNGFGLVITSGNQISGTLRDSDGTFSQSHLTTPAAALSLDEWHHVVAVFDRHAPGTFDDALLYIDGNLIGMTSGANLKSGNDINGTTQSLGSTDDFLLGALSTGATAGFGFTGLLDEVAIYNYALSGAQVAANFQAANFNAAAVPEPQSALLWIAIAVAAIVVPLRKKLLP